MIYTINNRNYHAIWLTWPLVGIVEPRAQLPVTQETFADSHPLHSCRVDKNVPDTDIPVDISRFVGSFVCFIAQRCISSAE